MDVQNAAPVAAGSTVGSASSGEIAPAAQSQPSSDTSHAVNTNASQGQQTLAAVVAKLYNVGQSSSGQSQNLTISYKYVSDLQLVVTVFTDPATGDEVQFPPQELIGLAELFDQIDGVTLDRKV